MSSYSFSKITNVSGEFCNSSKLLLVVHGHVGVPYGILWELNYFAYVNTSFCSSKFAWLVATRLLTLCITCG